MYVYRSAGGVETTSSRLDRPDCDAKTVSGSTKENSLKSPAAIIRADGVMSNNVLVKFYPPSVLARKRLPKEVGGGLPR